MNHCANETGYSAKCYIGLANKLVRGFGKVARSVGKMIMEWIIASIKR